MESLPIDRICGLIAQVDDTNLDSVCNEIHHYIRPENHSESIHAIATSIIDEAAGPGHTLVPQYRLAGVCGSIHSLCYASGHGAGAFLSASLPRRLSELCQKEFVNGIWKLEDGEDVELTSSVILDLAVLAGELYKLGLIEDQMMKKVYLDNLHCGYKGSDTKAQALCHILDLLATRWDMDPTSKNINVEQYVRCLIDYIESHDPPSGLVDEIQSTATQFGIQLQQSQRPSLPPSSGSSSPSHGSRRTPPQPNSSSPSTPDIAERHPVYFFRDGDVDLICLSEGRRTIFRIHSKQLVQHSAFLSELLSKDKLDQAFVFNGRPQIQWNDDPVEFATLMQTLYKQQIPFRSDRPPFDEFSSLLRLASKYQAHLVQDALLSNLRTVYTPWTATGNDSPIYHQCFGDPQPHPNEVLNLFRECQVDFALPLAFYEACMAGIKSLTSTDPSVKLPSVTLSQAVRGFYTLQKWEWRLARRFLLLDRQSHTSRKCRPIDLPSVDTGLPLQDVLRAIRRGSGVPTGGILRVPDFPNGDDCLDCVLGWNDIKQQVKVELWKSLPVIFGTEPWDEVPEVPSMDVSLMDST